MKLLGWSRSGAGGDADAVLAPVGGRVHCELAQDVLADGRPGRKGALEVGVLGVYLHECSQPCQQCLPDGTDSAAVLGLSSACMPRHRP